MTVCDTTPIASFEFLSWWSNMISHNRKYGIYHWDTFDNTTLLVDEADTLHHAQTIVAKRYGDRIGLNGADRVEIVDKQGNVVDSYSVG